MSTTAQLERFRRRYQLELPSRRVPKSKVRELWADAVATVSIVALASIVVAQILQIALR